MKKCIPVLLSLCLLLCGCVGQPSVPVDKPAPVTPATYYTPYYTDPAARSLRADVLYSSDSYTRLGRLNNLYGDYAAGVYAALGADALEISGLSAPDLRWVKVAFSTAAGEDAESFTLYENNFVLAEHPSSGQRRCVAAPGTYEAVLAYLDGVAAEQGRYFALSDKHIDDAGYHPASYTLYDAQGKATVSKQTAADTATVELVGAGLVRVIDQDGTRLYAPHEGKRSVVATGVTDLCGDRWAVADGGCVAVYALFGTAPLCRLYVAATEDNPAPVQGLDFSADGSELHVLVHNASGTLYDRTVNLQEEIDGATLRILGDWRETMIPATEKEEQITAYNILKKIRHKESELGLHLSSSLMGRLQVGDTAYFLCELGCWSTTESGAVSQYETVGYLMVTESLAAGYGVTLEDNELSWDTDDNWFKK